MNSSVYYTKTIRAIRVTMYGLIAIIINEHCFVVITNSFLSVANLFARDVSIAGVCMFKMFCNVLL